MPLCAGRWVELPSANTTLREVLGTDRAGDLPQMAQASVQTGPLLV